MVSVPSVAAAAFRSLFEQASDAMFVADSNGRYADVNAAGCRMLGYTKRELLGKTIDELMVRRDSVPPSTTQRAAAAGGSELGPCELVRKDGSRVRVTLRSQLLGQHWIAIARVQHDGEPDGHEPASAARAKRAFLASMSHELHTPLNSILGFTQLLARDRREPLSERHLERVLRIRKNAEQLLRLVEDVLDLARLEVEGLEREHEQVSVDRLLTEVRERLEPIAAQSGVTLTLETVPEAFAQLETDRARLAQIVFNFGSNAVKYNRPGGEVHFGVSCPRPGWLRLSVSDDGPGIAWAQQALLFEPFQRAGQETGPVDGTGVGLVISERLARLLGGRVGFRSAPEAGSVFWVELPARVGYQSGKPVPAVPTEQTERKDGKPHVLYIEDHPDNIAFMRDAFDALTQPMALDIAQTGGEGIARAHSERPALIVLDLDLPDMSGYDVVDALRATEDTKTIPVIALTAASPPADRARRLRAGFCHYLTKPIDLAALETTVLSALGLANLL